MGAIFKPVPWQVGQLIDGVQRGTISLPDLQRPFVWPAAKVRDLFDSMYRGYPVGELMFWDVPGQGDTRSISSDTQLSATHQIVDGQQRLTSLYAAIKGAKIRDSNYRARRMTIAFNPRTERFEVSSPAIAKSAQWIEDIAVFFRESPSSWKAYKKRLAENEKRVIDDDEDDLLNAVFQRLIGVQNYQFEVIHIQSDVPKRLVADIFVRINSEGVNLKAYDYILTWLSVFWPNGREAIESFARDSRVTPDRASELAERRISWTPKNPFIDVEPGHIVRAMVAMGQNRARLQDAYAALQAKDRTTGDVDAERQEQELAKLQKALPWVTNPINWDDFVLCVQTAGFRSRQQITSTTNLVYSYIMFLLGRIRFQVDRPILRLLIARWLFMSQMTSRYTGSSESQLQQDLDRFGRITDGDACGFITEAERVLTTVLTEDFWRVTVPEALVTSGPGLSPAYQCYLASLNILDAEMFLLGAPRVREWMDPSSPRVKGMEGHHLFPRNYLQSTLGITDLKRLNQAANFAPTDWDTNIEISDDPPQAYWPRLVGRRYGSESNLGKQLYWHALPEGWQNLDYEEFLNQRRKLMALVIRDGYQSIGQAPVAMPAMLSDDPPSSDTMTVLQTLLDTHMLRPGDLLDPVDPNWTVDAVVSDDGAILIDGIHSFDSLDDASAHLGVTNMDGLDFWALETAEGLISLRDLAANWT